MKVAIVGAGNFGTAIANIVAKNGFPAYLWMRDAAQLAEMRAHRENRRYLKGHALDGNVVPSGDLAESVGDADVIIVTVPSASFRQVTGDVAGACAPRCLCRERHERRRVRRLSAHEPDPGRTAARVRHRRHQRPQSGRGDRGLALHRDGGGQPLRGVAGGGAARVGESHVARVFEFGRLWRGTRRGAQERLRHHLRDGRGPRSGAEHRGHARHAQPRGDEPLRGVPRRQSLHLPRPRWGGAI